MQGASLKLRRPQGVAHALDVRTSLRTNQCEPPGRSCCRAAGVTVARRAAAWSWSILAVGSSSICSYYQVHLLRDFRSIASGYQERWGRHRVRTWVRTSSLRTISRVRFERYVQNSSGSSWAPSRRDSRHRQGRHAPMVRTWSAVPGVRTITAYQQR